MRCKPAFIDGIYEDLAWLRLDWPTPVRRQSEHLADYQQALETLKAMGLLYPCFCSRKEVEAEAVASVSAPQEGDGAEEVIASCS